MSWHTIPKDDAWKQVTLASLAAAHQRVWLRCNACGHELIADPADFAARHDLPLITPLLRIAAALRCTECGERKAHCWPEPPGIA
ncbi:MAG: hypothetical protein ACOYLQ_11205 [Hyphomicrobiaceae bacterium]|jgi:hypothetical protein